jgi:hypothetical protein
MAGRHAEDDEAFFRDRRKTWRASSRGTRLEQFLIYAGAAAHPAHFFGHRFGYDFETLRTLLVRAGFSRVDRSAFMESRDAVLRVDDRSTVAGAEGEGGHYSLFVEATA